MHWLVGVDEVGRGCLAGPVMVGVFAVQIGYEDLINHAWVRDSKALSAVRRGEMYEYLEGCAHGGHARFVVTLQSAQVVDSVGIVGAIRMCIAEALDALDIDPYDAYVYLDGGLRAPAEWIHQSTHIKGDRDYPVISAASIVAKVLRDEYMSELAPEYPPYGWDRNKGYGTLVHRTAIGVHGVTEYHRRSFLKGILNNI
jgi:ribonuclease HII